MNNLKINKVDPVDKSLLISRLKSILPSEFILHQTEDLHPYECDGLSAYKNLPLMVVLPNESNQVQAILKLCYELDVPVVARGAGTGLSGGALPLSNGVLLSLAKFKEIIDIDPVQRIARVQPGVRNLAISDDCLHHRW